jgi:hypothetical protein
MALYLNFVGDSEWTASSHDAVINFVTLYHSGADAGRHLIQHSPCGRSRIAEGA